jgi:hypothetical protein
VGLAYGDVLYVGRESQVLKTKPSPEFKYSELLQWCFIPQPAAFFRCEVWHAVGGLDDALKHAFDWDLWLRMARVTEVQKLPANLATFRWHGQSKTVDSAFGQNYEAIYVVRRRHASSHPLCDARDFAIATGRAIIRSLVYRAMGKL